MHSFLIILLVLSSALALMLGLLTVFQNLVERDCHGEPALHEPGPIFHHQVADYREFRSLFAWQSRSHFRGPD
ncbi:MAG: hypothetical protein QOF32_65 [Gammaproteobacteria bacterium]|jgi:hypothetical protein|nr:hypothetical protein [Gammaproteobacteria bacterium]